MTTLTSAGNVRSCVRLRRLYWTVLGWDKRRCRTWLGLYLAKRNSFSSESSLSSDTSVRGGTTYVCSSHSGKNWRKDRWKWKRCSGMWVGDGVVVRVGWSVRGRERGRRNNMLFIVHFCQGHSPGGDTVWLCNAFRRGAQVLLVLIIAEAIEPQGKLGQRLIMQYEYWLIARPRGILAEYGLTMT